MIVLAIALICSTISSATEHEAAEWPECAGTWAQQARELQEMGDAHGLLQLPTSSCYPERTELLRVLLLYSVSPSKYATLLVDSFPESRDGLMGELYEGIELSAFTPEFLFSFRSLGEIALSGDQRAIQKLLEALPLVDGVVADQMCEIAGSLAVLRKSDVEGSAACRTRGEVARALLRCSKSLRGDRGKVRALLEVVTACRPKS